MKRWISIKHRLLKKGKFNMEELFLFVARVERFEVILIKGNVRDIRLDD